MRPCSTPPPALGFAVSSALLAAGWAILPTALTQQDLGALVDTLSVLDDTRADEMQCATALAIVPNAMLRNRPDQAGLDLLRATYGTLVAPPVPNAAAIKRALNDRLPLARVEPSAPAMTAYRALAERALAALAGAFSLEALHAGA
jgi:cellulose biosynthesis protein BcsQ